jgi:hypothetical protein
MNGRVKSALKSLGIVLLGMLLGAILMKMLEMFLHALY